MPFQATTFSSDYIHLWRVLACETPEFRRFLRMPPAAVNDDAFGHDLAVADQMLADDVDIVELALRNRDEGGVPNAARLEAAEFRMPQRHRRIDRGSRDHIGEWHAHAQELGHGPPRIKGRPADAQGMDVRGNGVGIEAVGEHRAGRLEGEGALAVADIEQYAAFARLQHRPLHRTLGG